MADPDPNMHRIVNQAFTEAGIMQNEVEIKEQNPKHFLLNFDPSLILPPMAAKPHHYVQGKHPYWKSYSDCPDQLIDPIDNKSFGFWDSAQNQTFIYNFGYLKKDPKSNKFEFSFDPKETMFREELEEGNSSI